MMLLLNLHFTTTRFAFYYADINECHGNAAGCEHNCTNFGGGYTCTCGSGYTLATNLHNCLGKLDLNVLITLSLVRTVIFKQ